MVFPPGGGPGGGGPGGPGLVQICAHSALETPVLLFTHWPPWHTKVPGGAVQAASHSKSGSPLESGTHWPPRHTNFCGWKATAAALPAPATRKASVATASMFVVAGLHGVVVAGLHSVWLRCLGSTPTQQAGPPTQPG